MESGGAPLLVNVMASPTGVAAPTNCQAIIVTLALALGITNARLLHWLRLKLKSKRSCRGMMATLTKLQLQRVVGLYMGNARCDGLGYERNTHEGMAVRNYIFCNRLRIWKISRTAWMGGLKVL